MPVKLLLHIAEFSRNTLLVLLLTMLRAPFYTPNSCEKEPCGTRVWSGLVTLTTIALLYSLVGVHNAEVTTTAATEAQVAFINHNK